MSPRSPKRRRISISSLPAFEDDAEIALPPLLTGAEADPAQDEEEHERLGGETKTDERHMRSEEMDVDPDHGQIRHEIREDAHCAVDGTELQDATPVIVPPQQQQQPTFHRAPRFKQRDQDVNTHAGFDQQERHYDPL
ncbi:hypothetical protein Micbo1qcDRAFT_163730, partial [Microdochium bolleyi]